MGACSRSQKNAVRGWPCYRPLRSCSPQGLASLSLLLSGVWKWKSQNWAFFGEISHVRMCIPLLCFKSLRPFCGSSQTAHSSDNPTPQESQPCVYTFLQPLCGRARLLSHVPLCCRFTFFSHSSSLVPSLSRLRPLVLRSYNRKLSQGT